MPQFTTIPEVLLLVHALPILYCWDTRSLFATIVISILLQGMTELPWFVGRQVSMWGPGISFAITAALVATMTGIGSTNSLQREGFWRINIFNTLNIRLAWIWGTIASFVTQGSSMELLVGSRIDRRSNKLQEYLEKIEAMELKTKQLEHSVLKLKESQKALLEGNSGKVVKPVRSKDESVYVKSFPFNMKGTPLGKRKFQLDSTPETGKQLPKQERNRVTPEKVSTGLETILEQGEFSNSPRIVEDGVLKVDSFETERLAFDKPFNGKLEPVFMETSSPLFQPIPKTPKGNDLSKVLAEPRTETKNELGYFSLHGFPFSSSIKVLITRLLLQIDLQDQADTLLVGAEKHFAPRASQSMTSLDRSFQVTHENGTEEKQSLTVTIKHLIDDASMAKLKESMQSIRSLVFSEIRYHLQPYLSPEVLDTCNNILQYILWQSYLNRSGFWRLIVSSSLIPLKIFKMFALDIPLVILKFQLEVTCYIPFLLYRKLVPKGGLNLPFMDKYSTGASKPARFHPK